MIGKWGRIVLCLQSNTFLVSMSFPHSIVFPLLKELRSYSWFYLMGSRIFYAETPFYSWCLAYSETTSPSCHRKSGQIVFIAVKTWFFFTYNIGTEMVGPGKRVFVGCLCLMSWVAGSLLTELIAYLQRSRFYLELINTIFIGSTLLLVW